MTDNRTQKNNGFTMIETLVAIFILLLSITGPLAVAQSGLKAAFIARDQTIAFYLAQDAMELIKNIRDNNFVKDRDWLHGLADCVGESALCTVDTTKDDQGVSNEMVQTCPQNPGCFYEGDDNNTGLPLNVTPNIEGVDVFGFEGTASKFYRTVKLEQVVQDQEVRVTVKVKWYTDDGTERTVIARENIFNWVPNYGADSEEDD